MFGNLKMVIVFLYIIVNNNRNTDTKKFHAILISSYLIGLQMLLFYLTDHTLHPLLKHLLHVNFKGGSTPSRLEILISG